MSGTPDNQLVDHAILEALNAADGYPMNKATLISHVRIKVTPRPLDSETKDRIRSLDSEGLIEGVKERDGYTYTLTSKGKHYWKQHGS